MKPQPYQAHLTLIRQPQKNNPTKTQIRGFYWRIVNPEKPDETLAENTYTTTGTHGLANIKRLCCWFQTQLTRHNPEIIETILHDTLTGTILNWDPLPTQTTLPTLTENLTLTTRYTHKNRILTDTILTLAEHNPHVAALAHGDWNPQKTTYSSNQTKTWKCPKPECGHIWETTPSDMIRRGGKKEPCPLCDNRITITGINDLATTHPHLARQALGWSPEEYNQTYGKKMLWRCDTDECSYEWSAAINQRIARNSRCPLCSNKITVPGRNDLATTHPHLIDEIADNTDPTTIQAGTHKRILWKCRTCSYTWSVVVHKRAVSKHQCPCCANRVIVRGINDLATTHPEIAQELLNFEDAYTLTYGSDKRPEWVCRKPSCRYVWKTAVCIKVKQNTGCPCCNHTLVHPGCSDLATTHPEIAATLVDTTWATKVSAGSEKVLEWKCPNKLCNNTWKTRVFKRTQRKGCPACAKVLKGVNDLATKMPKLANQAHGWDPTEYSWKSAVALEWKCPNKNCENIWTTPIATRSSGHNCPACSYAGYKPNLPAYLYLLTRTVDGKQQTQIGISNYIKQRLKQHKRNNWKTIETLGPCDGEQIYEIEQTFLHTIRNTHNIPTGAKAFPERFDGYTEAWWNDQYPTRTIADILFTCGINPHDIHHISKKENAEEKTSL